MATLFVAMRLVSPCSHGDKSAAADRHATLKFIII